MSFRICWQRDSELCDECYDRIEEWCEENGVEVECIDVEEIIFEMDWYEIEWNVNSYEKDNV